REVGPPAAPASPGEVEIIHPEALDGFSLQTLLWDWDNTVWNGFPHDLEEQIWAQWAFQTQTPTATQLETTKIFFKGAQGLTRKQTIEKWRDEGHPDPGGFKEFLPKLEEAINREAL